MGLDDDDEEADAEDEWRALLEKGWKKATAVADEAQAEPAAEAPAEALEAEAAEGDAEMEAEEAAEATEEVPEADAAEAEETAEGEVAEELEEAADTAVEGGDNQKPLFGEFEISDEEEDDGALEAEDIAEEAAEEAAEAEVAVEEDVALEEEPEAAEAPASATPGPVAKAPVTKAPVAKRPPVAKAPVAKMPAAKASVVKMPAAKAPVAKTAPPAVVKATIAKRPPAAEGAAPQSRPPLAIQGKPQAPGQQAAQPQILAPKGAGKAGPAAARPVGPVAAAAKGAGKGGGKVAAATDGGKGSIVAAAVAAANEKAKAAAAGSSKVAIAVAAANAAAAARKAAGGPGASGGAVARSASAEGGEEEAPKSHLRSEYLKKAHQAALKALKNLPEEQRKEKLPRVRKAMLDRMLMTGQAAGGDSAATETTPKPGFLARMKQGVGLKGKGKEGKGKDGKGGAGKGVAGKGKDGKGKDGKGGGSHHEEDSYDGGAKKWKSWDSGNDYGESSSGDLKRKSSSQSLPGEKEKKKKVKSYGEDETQVSALDTEGRRYDFKHIVVNMANVGATFSKKVLGKKDGDRLFDREGVRRCVRHLKCDKKLKVIGVLNENFRGPDNQGGRQVTMPDDITRMCESVEETPRLTGKCHSSADDEMTIKCAYRRNCRFLDNDNYRDWLQQLRDPKIRTWLNTVQDLLQMRYYFDKGLGSFDVLEGNIPAYMLAEGKDVDKRELWTAKRSPHA